MDFTGKSVLVVGASGGIGGAAAKMLLERGANVCLTYRTEDSDVSAIAAGAPAGQLAMPLSLDVTSRDALREAVADTTDRLGGLDACISTVGYIHTFQTFLDTSDEEIDRHLDVELRGTISLTRALLPGFLEQGHGSVTIVGSDSGKVGMIGEAASAAARGGVNAFVKTIASEYGRQGIRMNAVCPGPIDTDLWRRIEGSSELSDKLVGAVEASVPMKRSGTAEEAAALAVFLASDLATYVTGQTISVNGGGVRC